MLGKILITGSSGKIGQELTKFLSGVGYSIVEYDRLNDSEEELLREENLAYKMEGCKGVIHLAAISRVDESKNNQSSCFQTNVEGTASLLRGVQRQKVPPWLIFSSSREVYGNSKQSPIPESTELKPINEYGESKQRAEEVLLRYFSQGGRGCIFRLANVYGMENDFSTRIVPAFCNAALSNSPLKLCGTERELDLVHIDDISQAFHCAIKYLEGKISKSKAFPAIFDPFPSIFNLGGGKGIRLEELAKLCKKITNSSSSFFITSPPKHHVHSFLAEIEAAKQNLKWTPQIDLEQGIQLYLEKLKTSTEFKALTSLGKTA